MDAKLATSDVMMNEKECPFHEVHILQGKWTVKKWVDKIIKDYDVNKQDDME